ncbi:hypothetical protein M514_10522 [Trichuris suis]|uniref:Uncharacterized protein n=1 Tax=Trichuris suis TaxID=68888 RepID=A0A085LUE2_9BILA|nr:hypothetical protein M513_10522 [Trichuris suis]KFD63976.1 hypothetical protein M514_10522 [Trichuris suis]
MMDAEDETRHVGKAGTAQVDGGQLGAANFLPIAVPEALVYDWLGFEEMECQDVKDIPNCQQDELTTSELQEKQKEEKKQMMRKPSSPEI